MPTCPVERLPLVPLAAPHHPLRPDHDDHGGDYHDDHGGDDHDDDGGDVDDGDEDDDDGGDDDHLVITYSPSHSLLPHNI